MYARERKNDCRKFVSTYDVGRVRLSSLYSPGLGDLRIQLRYAVTEDPRYELTPRPRGEKVAGMWAGGFAME